MLPPGAEQWVFPKGLALKSPVVLRGIGSPATCHGVQEVSDDGFGTEQGSGVSCRSSGSSMPLTFLTLSHWEQAEVLIAGPKERKPKDPDIAAHSGRRAASCMGE